MFFRKLTNIFISNNGTEKSSFSRCPKRSYAHNDYISDYNAYKGNAYGLGNTLRQTAIFKPKMHSSKLENLVYAGQLTTPGPGVPPVIISGQVAAGEIIKINGK